MNTVRVRFAPSPTGHLHIGGLRTALFNVLFAKHMGGTFLLRVEDTDIERSKPEYVASQLASLEWANIVPDEPLVYQLSRINEHKQIINRLLAEGKVYKCYCTENIEYNTHIDNELNDQTFLKYNRTCRSLPIDHISEKPYVIRFALPDQGIIEFNDLIRGPIAFNTHEFDDFIIARSDGTPMYNFVVVADDAFMKITHVIRGEDHISNTPKQILLYQACGYNIPHFAHLPLILGPSGQRLSKRDAATSVTEYKDAGFLPAALINYLVRLGWSHGDQEVFTFQELVNYFSLEQVGKKSGIFDIKKLEWLNGLYMRQSSAHELYNYIRQYIDHLFKERLSTWSTGQIIELIELYKSRTHTLKELINELIAVHDKITQISDDDAHSWINENTKEHLKTVQKSFELLETFTQENITAAVKQIALNLSIKLITIAQPIRLALIGKSSGPGVFELCTILGKTKTVERIQELINSL